MEEGKAFPMKPKRQRHLSHWEIVFMGNNHEKKGYYYMHPCLSQMMERKAFPLKPKCQYHLSQWKECVYSANHEKKGDYYVHPFLS